MKPIGAKFALGTIVATPGALDALTTADDSPSDYIRRHAELDRGTLCDEDVQSNLDAVRMGLRVFSAFTLSDGVKIWIITEADRSVTTVLLPEEY